MNHSVPKRDPEGDPEQILTIVLPFNRARPIAIEKIRRRQHNGMNCTCHVISTLAGHLPVIHDMISKLDPFTTLNPAVRDTICQNSRERPRAVISVSNVLRSVEACQTVSRTTLGATLPSARAVGHRITGDM
jgi:hypothetical protein